MAIIEQILSKDGKISCLVMDSTDMVAELLRIHHTTPTSTAALGRLITACSMMGIGLKNPNHSLTLRLLGDGPSGALIAVSDGRGNAKAYMSNSKADAPPKYPGKLDVGAIVGKNGLLTVIKDMGLKEPYIGQSALISGEIAEDIAAYFAESEQIPTVCGLGVLVTDNQVVAAGGFIAQLMPGSDESHINLLEKNTAELEMITTLLCRGGTEALTNAVLQGTDWSLLLSTEVNYRCNCSRERVSAALITMGADEINKMADEQETSEVTCHFCDKVYNFTSDELRKLAVASQKTALEKEQDNEKKK